MQEKYISLIDKYLHNTISEEEKTAMISWLEENQENRDLFAAMASVSSAAEKLKDHADEESMMARLNARIDAEQDRAAETMSGGRGTKALTLTRRLVWIPVAAALAVWAYIARPENGAPASERNFITYTNTADDISAIMLGDSTKVWLGMNASMKCDVDCMDSDRVVELTGEAYFDVHRDTLHPFIVRTKNLDIRVLGTAFCVKSDTVAGKVSVVLERGSVRLQTPEGVNLVRLSPDQKAEFDAASGDIAVESINATPYIVQNYNKITLTGATAADIVSHINEMYGVNVRIVSKTDLNTRYNLNYRRTDSIDTVLRIVTALTGAELEME